MNCDTLEILRALKPFVACFFFASAGLFAAAFLWYGAIRHLFFTETEIALGKRLKRRRQNFPPPDDDTKKAMSELAGAMADLKKSEEWRKFTDA